MFESKTSDFAIELINDSKSWVKYNVKDGFSTNFFVCKCIPLVILFDKDSSVIIRLIVSMNSLVVELWKKNRRTKRLYKYKKFKLTKIKKKKPYFGRLGGLGKIIQSFKI